MRRSQRTVLAMLLAIAASITATTGLVTGAGPAGAAVRDPVMSGTQSPMWQTNNNVEALTTANGVVYAGGTFTRVRPPGAAAGTQEVTRTYLAAFNASTGALITSFNVALNGRVYDLVVSPDGSRLYIVGGFTTVNGVTRNRVAAINLPSGTLNTQFNANAGYTVTAVELLGSRLYLGGDFGRMGGVVKSRMAAVNATTGALIPTFSADVEARVLSIEAAEDGSRLLVGGGFRTVGGVTTGGMASLDPATGALREWRANVDQPINTNCGGRVTDIVVDGDTAYVTGEGDPPGCYEGTYAARVSDGQLQWLSSCLGASMGLAVLDGILYKASHQHDCAFTPGDARGGYVGGTARDTFIWWRLVAQDVRDGSFIHWTPNTNAVTGSNPVGPHVLATDGSQLFVGGDFTRVDNTPQQGLIRYRMGGNNSAPERPAPVTVQSTRVGTLTVQWPSVIDRDNGTLTYRLYRNGGTTPISTQTVESFPWSRPVMRFDDTGLAPGSTHSYQVQVSDGTFTSTRSVAASAAVRTSAPAAYGAAVRSLGGNLLWELDEGSGTGVADSSGSATAGTVEGGATRGVPGATGGTAVRLTGSGYLRSNERLNLTSAFTQSVWFKTTSITGGSLLAVTDVPTGVGTISDRAVTMDNNGNVVFSVHAPSRPGSPNPFGPWLNNVRLQGPVYNDGRWHQVVATWSGTTAALYVDGILSGTYTGTAGGLSTGYQRVGYTDLRGEQAVFGRNFYSRKWPLTEHFSGDLDAVATFPTALNAGQVAELFAAGVNGAAGAPVTPEPPTDPEPPEEPGDPVASVPVPEGSSWRWKYDDAALPASWNANGFDAGGWSLGNAVLGFGAAVATDVDTFATTDDRPRAAYFTRTFEVADASDVTSLVLRTVANDGVVVYVNGTEVGRHNMRDGVVTPMTYAPSARNVTVANADPVVIDVPTSLLVDGTNTIAAETHVNYRATRDLTFDLRAELTSLP